MLTFFAESAVFSVSVVRRAAALAVATLTIGVAASAQTRPDTSTAAPSPDPRVGLHAGWLDAAQALWNLKLVSFTPRPEGFVDDTNPGDFGDINSDLAFDGHYAIQGNFHGVEIWDLSHPAHPTLVTGLVCPASQNDVSVYRNLLFVSVESVGSSLDCGTLPGADSVDANRERGVRVFDISDITHPKLVANVQTCRGSHTHTVVTSPADTANVYIYVSGTAPVRPASELAGCSALRPDQDSTSEMFRIEVIQVPLAHPEQARVVSKPEILGGLLAPPHHPEASQDIARAAHIADSARAAGAFTANIFGMERVLPARMVEPLLDSLVEAHGGSGAPTAADSAMLRDSLQSILDRMLAGPAGPGGARPGPVQCHDITVYPALALAGGACAGYGLLLDIRDPANPRRLAAVSDSNFSFWHSATFDNAGTKVLFTDEWGGGLQPRCRATDPSDWGADAIFTIGSDRSMTFQGYYKLPAPQTEQENCVAHNGSLIPVPGRDIMVQAWYQGGISVFDWTDPAHPREIAFFDRGPVDSTKLVAAGSWSAYWYNGYIVSSEIGRGLDILELLPNGNLTADEIAAAKTVRFAQENVQDQQRLVWPPSFALPRAYLDQLARSGGLGAARIRAARTALASAERASGARRRTALTRLATSLNRDAAGASDQAKVRTLADAVRDLANARR
jgi:hypothetical protein